MSVFVAVAAQTLLHLPLGKIPSLKNYLTELPVGMRLWGCYVLAHESYLKQEYEKSLGIIGNQASEDYFRAHTDFVVENNGNVEKTWKQIDEGVRRNETL